MPTIDDLGNSKYLKKTDVGEGKLLTIDRYENENVSPTGVDYKYVLHFKEPGVKPMVLNKTNGSLIASIAGSTNLDNWSGTKIVLYNDPTVSYAGQIKGGIRVRPPQMSGGMEQSQQQQYKQASDAPPPPTEDPRDFSNGNPDEIDPNSIPF